MHANVIKTGSERLIWGQGSASTLRAVTTVLNGVPLTLASAICWENYMPLLRQSLYSQNVNIYLAPTADARDTWLPLMRTVGGEGRCFVLSANQCVRTSQLPDWITATEESSSVSAQAASSSQAQAQSEGQLPKQSISQGQGQGQGQSQSEAQGPPVLMGRNLSVTAEGPHEIVWPQGQGPDQPDQSPKQSTTPEKSSNRTTSQIENVTAQVDALASRVGKLGQSKAVADEFVSRGGSCIVSPLGAVLAGPLWEVSTDDSADSEDAAASLPTGPHFTAGLEKEAVAVGDGLAIAHIDLDDCERGRLDLDVAGSYSRSDAFKLSVEGLNLDPPPM